MENKVIVRSNKERSVTKQGLYSEFGFFGKKHEQALGAAQELLCKTETSGTTIYDSLNCGKLSRLITYIKNGSAFALLWISCYSEYVLA